MNNGPYKKSIVIVATSPEEYEGLMRYKLAKKDNKSYKIEFHIGKNNEVKSAITEYLK